MGTENDQLIADLLEATRQGDRSRIDELYRLVYDELHRQAGFQRKKWQGDLTLNTTALVHEAYLKLAGRQEASWESRAHFMAVAAKAMRHILTDHARRRRAEKRGGDVPRLSLEELVARGGVSVPMEEKAQGLLDLHEALECLAREDPRAALIVECRFFGEMTIPDIATATGLSESTVKRDWTLAQAWLRRELSEGDPHRDHPR
ncbi:MAG: sigma-70 family RNA polymerase sigma factor [Rhodothermales bacterium]|nr:sigma-70 family RNA polymerase sigma factor [Rhodothermales bacterium]MBO6779011.1 sigma-70 family RNA polymerase sigma factor [Rhodothermales bacterium]